jgi:hypothetical protein
MPRVGFEPTTPLFERAKTVHDCDRQSFMYIKYFMLIKAKTRNYWALISSAASSMAMNAVYCYWYSL